MCVSAEASFGLTGVLVPVGIYCLKTAARRDWLALPIATIPLLFGVQQFCEGLVWVGVGRGDAELTRFAALGYLFFALAFWLFWIPFSAVFFERRPRIKWILGLGAFLGLMGGAIQFVPVVLNPEALRVTVIHHSIRYDYPAPPPQLTAPPLAGNLFYLAVISLPLVFMKYKKLIGYCTALVVSAVISHVFFLYAFASVWCFFAAILSLYLAYLFYKWPLPTAEQEAGRQESRPSW